MKYTIGDKFVLKGVECYVGLIGASGQAYLFPMNEGDRYKDEYLLIGVCFTKVNEKGLNEYGHKVFSVSKTESRIVS